MDLPRPRPKRAKVDASPAWQAERAWEETAEFVESIPFTETREYVQVVVRNAEIYRRLYGKQP